MKTHVITSIENVKLKSLVNECIAGFNLNALSIFDYEEFFEALIHVDPVMLIVEINQLEDPFFKIVRIIKKSELVQKIPIIILTHQTEVDFLESLAKLEVHAILYAPIVKSIVCLNMFSAIKLKRSQSVINDSQDLQTVQSVMITGLATLAEYRDPETGEHIKRTQNYVKALAIELRKKGYYQAELTDKNIEAIYMAAPLHDIGKVGIRDEILLKPAKLDDAEYEIMKTHTTLGYEAILSVGNRLKHNIFLDYAADITYTHHEKYDGSGYPNGLKGEEIPLAGRLMAVADVYDALISKRIYKEALNHSEAVKIIKSGSGTHFDPLIVECLLSLERTFINIANTYKDSDGTFDSKTLILDLKQKGLLKKVLIVEDSRIVRTIAQNQLLAMGFMVDVACDGREGLKYVEANDYDLVLLDIEMPKMNGYEMAKAVMKTKNPPIMIAMTAADYNITIPELKKLGIQTLLLKPLDFNRLASKYLEIINSGDHVVKIDDSIEKYR